MKKLLRATLIVTLGITALVANRLRRSQRPVYSSPQSLIHQPPVEVGVIHTESGAYQIHLPAGHPLTRVYAGASPETIARESPVAVSSDDSPLLITGINSAARPVFELVFADGRRILAAERTLRLAGAVNVRDVGGYPTTDGRRVRWGKLYRAGALSQLTDDDLAVLQQIGVRLICDLRSPPEVEQAPDRLPADGSIRYRHLPIDPDDQDKQAARRRLRALLFDKPALAAMMRDIYIRSIEEHAEAFAAVMQELADPDNLPLLVHCTAGKDRTGLNIAFVLLALGVPQEVIIADYTLSNMYYDHFYRLTEQLVKPLRLFGVHPDDMLPMLTADPDRLRAVLDYFDAAYGTVAAYLEYKTGLDPAVIEQVRNNLLE